MSAPSQTPTAEGPGAPPPPSLRTTTARGFVWVITQSLFVRGLSLVGFVVLARLLSPHDYGVVAIANVFVLLLQMLAASGYSQALVQKPTVDKTDLDTIFWIGLGTSVALAALLSAAAWPLADVYDEPQLRPVLQVLSLTFVFVALGSTPIALLQRRLQFSALAWPTMVANVVATAAGITFALVGFGVWSLVIQTVLAPAVGLFFLVPLSGYRPGRSVSAERFRELFAVSRHFLIGAYIGSAALGVYSVAYRVLTVMIEVLSSSARSVAYPVFARVQDDRQRLARAYTSATRMCAVIAMPGFLLAFATAPEIIRVVFGSKWDAAIPVMRILCLYGPLQAVMQFNGSLLQSVGKARLVFHLSLIGTLLQVIGFAITVQFGIEWVAASFVIRAYLTAPVGFLVAARAVGDHMRSHVAALVAPTISSLIMVAAVLGFGGWLDGHVPMAVKLVAMLVGGIVVYLGALRVIGPQALREAIGYAGDVIRRKAPGPPPQAD